MAKNSIPEELQALINQYLTDGVLTDKERAVILKKAEGMGLDHDEIDLYLDAEVQKIDQATDAAVRKQKETCPYCGGSVPQLADKCPHCGENITVQASEELQEIFDNLEEALIDLKAGKDISRSKATVERYTRKARIYYGNNPKIQKLLEEVENEMLNVEKKAKSIAKKKGLLNILKNKWIWCVIESIVMVIAIMSLSSRASEYDAVYQSKYGGNITAYNEGQHAKSDRNNMYIYIFIVIIGGSAVVYFTGKQAVQDGKKE